MYLAHIRTIVSENFTNQSYINRANQMRLLIDAHVQNDTNKFYTYSAGHPNGFLDAFGNIYTAISKVILEKTGKNTAPLILNLKQNYNIMSIMNTMHKASKKGGWNKVKTI